MLRFCLTTMVCWVAFAYGQQKSEYLLLAEKMKTANMPQAIQHARQAFVKAVKQKDAYNACLCGIFLGEAYRTSGSYDTATYYDSLAVLQARQRPADTLLQQKAVMGYIRNFFEQLKTILSDSLLEQHKQLFMQYPSYQTCQWYEMRGLCSYNDVKIAVAIEYGKKAREVAEQIQDTTAIMHARLMIFKFQSLFIKADNIRSAFEVLSYFESIRHYSYIAQAANIIGFAFETTHNTEKALEYYKKAYISNVTAHNEIAAMENRMNMADALIGANQLLPAKNILWEGLQYYSAKHRTNNIAYAALRLAKIYFTTEKSDSALVFFKITDSLNGILKNKIIAAASALYQGLLQGKMGNFKQRDSLAGLVVKQLLQEGFRELIPVAEQRLRDGAIGRMPDSIRKKSASIKPMPLGKVPDSATENAYYDGVENMNWQTGANSEYENTFTEKQSYQQLQADNEYKMWNIRDTIRSVKKETDNARQQSLRWQKVVGVVTIFMLLLGNGLWLQYKSRRRAERDRAQIEALQKEIHHRVTNNLGVINTMVEMAGKAKDTQMPAAALKTRIDSIALVHRLLYSGKAAAGKISLQPYFQELSKGIAAIFEHNKPVKITIDAPVETDSVLAEKLGLIVNELITNSFKYAFTNAENATIHLYARQQKTNCI